MSGIRAGSRLHQLHALRARIDHEIAIETQREADATAGLRNPPARHTNPDDTPPSILVKRWALNQGLITEIRRGRVAQTLVDAYLNARQNGATQ